LLEWLTRETHPMGFTSELNQARRRDAQDEGYD